MKLKETVEIEESNYKKALELAFTDYLEDGAQTPEFFKEYMIDRLLQYNMRYLVNMVYKYKGKSYLTYEVDAESEDEAIELAKVGEVISTDEFFDGVQLEGELESISVEEDE